MTIRMIVEGINDPAGTAGQGLPIPVSTVQWRIERAAAPVPLDDDAVGDRYEFSDVDLLPVQVTKPVDGMTPWLFAAATTPGAGRTITLLVGTDTGPVSLETRITLGDAVIDSYALTAQGSSLVETLTIVYRSVNLGVATVESDGTAGKPITAAYPAG
jgi:type VI protein secretion system component Hcp